MNKYLNPVLSRGIMAVCHLRSALDCDISLLLDPQAAPQVPPTFPKEVAALT